MARAINQNAVGTTMPDVVNQNSTNNRVRRLISRILSLRPVRAKKNPPDFSGGVFRFQRYASTVGHSEASEGHPPDMRSKIETKIGGERLETSATNRHHHNHLPRNTLRLWISWLAPNV
jgi:hypothetical protein